MKRSIASFVVLVFALSAKAQDWNYSYDRTITNAKAVIHFLNEETVVIIPDSNSSQRYIAHKLPQEYKKEGLHVTITGDAGKIPPNVRMLGTPLKLKCICVTKTEQKKFNLKQRKYSFK